jgi:hypothetical protein
MMILLSTVFFACDTIQTQLKSPEEQLIDLRFEQKNAMDSLYTEYGGGSLVENINKNSDSVTDKNAKGFLSALKTTVASTDRATFESGCLELGQGKNVPFFTEKAKTFFAKPETLAVCKASALRHLEIQKLELQVQVPTE